jgi:aminoglycoside 3-N-acetyltransferase
MAIEPVLYAQLQELGVQKGDVLLVHSAFKVLRGASALTPQDVIDTLIAVTGADQKEGGTLLMPALSYQTVNEQNNLFEQEKTPSCVGVIAETFRRCYPVQRSVHPTHSVCALGALALPLTREHQLDRTPVGEHSPYALLPSYGGKILMLGCGLKPMTFMHGVEEFVRPDYLLRKNPVTYRIHPIGQEEYEAQYLRHDFAGYLQRYDRLEGLMTEGIVSGTTLGGESYLLDSRKVKEAGLQALKADPHYFVDSDGRSR